MSRVAMYLIWSRVDNFPPFSTLKPQIFDIRILSRQSALQINSVSVSALRFFKK